MGQGELPHLSTKKVAARTNQKKFKQYQESLFASNSIEGQATYQTDVTSIPLDIPGIPIEDMSKDQYKIVAEVNQLIYDGGEINNQQERLHLAELMQFQEVEINLYNLRERVSDLFFGILLTDEQILQRKYIEETLEATLSQAEVALENGVTYRSSVNELKA